MSRWLACVAFVFALAGPANAQRVLTREAGRVEFHLAPLTESLSVTRSVAPGEALWTETLAIPDAVRLNMDVPRRAHPAGAAVSAGTVLYAYQLRTGAAYCPPFELDVGHVPRVQCFRDFNGDGIFDGAYVAESANRSWRAFPRHVYALAGQRGGVNYTRVAPEDAPRIEGFVYFDGMNSDGPRLRLSAPQYGLWSGDCTPTNAPDVCVWYGVTIRYAARGEGGAEITVLNVAADRRIGLYMSDAR